MRSSPALRSEPDTPTERAGRAHWPGLDGLRGFAAIAVVLFHAGFGPAVNGYAGVDVFFALSGFLIASLLLRERARTGAIALGRFYIRRLLRLYPALLATCVFVLLIAAATHKLDREAGPALAALLYVANWWIYLGKPAPLLDHTWTLAIEEHFYAIWPAALTLLLGRRQLRRAAGWALIVVVCLAIAVPWPGSIDSVRGSYLRGVPIVWGSLLAIALRRWALPRRAGTAVLWAGSVLLLLLLLTPTTFAQDFVTGPAGLAGWLSVLVVAGIVNSPGGSGGWWGSAPLVWIGRRSYGLYLYHFPILSLFAYQLGAGPQWLRRLIALPVVFLVTAVSYRVLETPFLELKNRLSTPRSVGRHRAQPAAAQSWPGRAGDAQCYRRSRDAHLYARGGRYVVRTAQGRGGRRDRWGGDGFVAAPAGEPDPGVEAMDRRTLQDKAVRGAAWTMIHTVTSVPIAFVVNILLARFLGVAHYGRLAFLMTLMDVVSGVVALGVTTGTLQFGAKAHAAGHRDEVRALLSKAQGFRLVFVAPVLTVVVVLVARVDLPILFLALVFGVWVPGFFDGVTTCLAIENKSATAAKNAMVVNLLRQAGIVAALLLGGSADVIWAARLALGSIGIALALLVVDRSYRAAVLRPQLPRHLPPGFWKFVVPTAIASLIATLALSRTEVFFLQWFSDTAAVGLFALAFGLASHIFSPAQALVGPLIPAISGLREVDTAAIVPAFFRTLRTSVMLVGALCVVGVPALALLIPRLYGSAFGMSAGMFVALSISAGMLVAGAPVGAFVLGRLAARTILVVDLVALAVDVGLAITLIPVIGGWGAVVANMAGSLTLLGLLVNSEMRALSLSWSQLLGVTHSLYLAFAACVLAWFVVRGLGLPAPVGAVVASVAATVAWVLAVRVLRAGLSAGDITALERVVPARLRRRARFALAPITTAAKSEDGAPGQSLTTDR